MDLVVSEGSLTQAYELTEAIPEFSDQKYPLSEYQKRLGNGSLVLVGYHIGKPVGFKAGYPRGRSDRFYSWMGGVLPHYCRYGLAKALAIEQERWAKQHGYRFIWLKTRNRNRAMLIFALQNGFSFIEVQAKGNPENNRIIMEKEL